MMTAGLAALFLAITMPLAYSGYAAMVIEKWTRRHG